jgi:hypothetical protein
MTEQFMARFCHVPLCHGPSAVAPATCDETARITPPTNICSFWLGFSLVCLSPRARCRLICSLHGSSYEEVVRDTCDSSDCSVDSPSSVQRLLGTCVVVPSNCSPACALKWQGRRKSRGAQLTVRSLPACTARVEPKYGRASVTGTT